jgi:hypothetical protein
MQGDDGPEKIPDESCDSKLVSISKTRPPEKREMLSSMEKAIHELKPRANEVSRSAKKVTWTCPTSTEIAGNFAETSQVINKFSRSTDSIVPKFWLREITSYRVIRLLELHSVN